MFPKSIRDKRQQAKKSSVHFKRIIKKMDACLASSGAHDIEVASAFYKILEYHVDTGDLSPYNVQLAALLRKE